jgi:hypothetical protein
MHQNIYSCNFVAFSKVYCTSENNFQDKIQCCNKHSAASLSDTFSMSRKASNSLIMSIRLSTCISTTPTGRISVKLDAGDLYGSLLINPIMVKIGQEYRALYMKTYVCYIVTGDINLP